MRGEEYPELLSDVALFVKEALISKGIDVNSADEIADATADHVATYFGGQLLYIPNARSYKTIQRDNALFGEFDGNNHLELARKYSISLQNVYLALRRHKARNTIKKET